MLFLCYFILDFVALADFVVLARNHFSAGF